MPLFVHAVKYDIRTISLGWLIWNLFSTPAETAAPTPSMSHITVQTTEAGITATYSSATLGMYTIQDYILRLFN